MQTTFQSDLQCNVNSTNINNSTIYVHSCGAKQIIFGIEIYYTIYHKNDSVFSSHMTLMDRNASTGNFIVIGDWGKIYDKTYFPIEYCLKNFLN